MNQNSYFTNVVTHADGTMNYIGLYKEKTCVANSKLVESKYPNSTVEVKEVFGMVPCWNCGEPILFTDRHASEQTHQAIDKLCCSPECEVEKRKHYS